MDVYNTFDIDFKETLVNQKLNDSLPDGMNTVAVGVVETSEDSLQEAVDSCIWKVKVSGVGEKQCTFSRQSVLQNATCRR